jgi:hypothetical protein
MEEIQSLEFSGYNNFTAPVLPTEGREVTERE